MIVEAMTLDPAIRAEHRLKPAPPVLSGRNPRISVLLRDRGGSELARDSNGVGSGTGFSRWSLLASALVLIVPAQPADLSQTLDALLDSSPVAAHSNFGIHVVDLKTGKPLYSRNEDRLLLPASNMKLFTTALALQKLGAGYRFQTRVLEEATGDVGAGGIR